MESLRQRPDLQRRLPGLVLVVLLHVVLVYALVNGLGKRIIDVVRAPVETKIIEEPKKPPPPLMEIALPPPPMTEPPPPFIPPPEIRIALPKPVPRIVVATPKAPPAPVVLTPAPAPPAPQAPPAPPAPKAAPAPPVPPAPPAPAAKPPAVLTAGVACSNYRTKMGEASYPRRARRLGIERGEALIQFTLKADGRVANVKALSATHPVFAQASMRIVEQFLCKGQGHDVVVRVPFGYRLQ